MHQSCFRLHPGGLNFDAKLRRESTDLRDIFYAHIRCAASVTLGADSCFSKALQQSSSCSAVAPCRLASQSQCFTARHCSAYTIPWPNQLLQRHGCYGARPAQCCQAGARRLAGRHAQAALLFLVRQPAGQVWQPARRPRFCLLCLCLLPASACSIAAHHEKRDASCPAEGLHNCCLTVSRHGTLCLPSAGTSRLERLGLKSWRNKRWLSPTPGLPACPAGVLSCRKSCCHATCAERAVCCAQHTRMALLLSRCGCCKSSHAHWFLCHVTAVCRMDADQPEHTGSCGDGWAGQQLLGKEKE